MNFGFGVVTIDVLKMIKLIGRGKIILDNKGVGMDRRVSMISRGERVLSDIDAVENVWLECCFFTSFEIHL
jgi:hypothetical protein